MFSEVRLRRSAPPYIFRHPGFNLLMSQKTPNVSYTKEYPCVVHDPIFPCLKL